MYFLNIYLFVFLWVYSNAHLLPEDGVSDNEEQLNREKRDNLFDSILKTIPFFNPTIDQEEPVDPNDDDEVAVFTPTDDSSITETSAIPTMPVLTSTSSMQAYLKSTFPSATLHEMNKTSVLSSLISTNFSSSIQTNSTNIQKTILPTFSISMTANLATTKLLTNFSNFVLKTTYKTSSSLPTLTYPSSKHVGHITPSASDIQPSSSSSVPVSSTFQSQDTIINMMIMPGEQAILPNEKGYGDTVAAEPVDKDMKNIRYLYRNVLVPVMSGILGALLITFSIIIYKCIRRRKLQKVRYYGGKPNASLYRLDHMSLLSDDSSDED